MKDARVEALRDHLNRGVYGLTTQECDAVVCAFDEVAKIVDDARALVGAAEGESLRDALLRGFAERDARTANAEAAFVLIRESAAERARARGSRSITRRTRRRSGSKRRRLGSRPRGRRRASRA